MGRRGPRPTPTHVLKLHNSWRGNLNPDEPQPTRGIPTRPDWLGPNAGAMWDEIVPILHGAGMLSIVDGAALIRYCDAWERWLAARKFLAEHGEMYPVKDRDGRVRCFLPFPQNATYHQMATLLGRLEQEIGLTPSARSRIRVLPSEVDREKDEMIEALFSGGGPAAPRGAVAG